MTAPDDVRDLFDRVGAGDADAVRRAFALLHDELARLAHAQRARWTGNETLNTTALVHEAFLKLAGPDGNGARWEGRKHFFALASQVMRQVLVTYAEARGAAKRGGGADVVPLDEAPEAALAGETGRDDARILALHAALADLAEREPRQAQVVECRFFGGLSIPETAEALGVSPATVKRDWEAASAWLYGVLNDG
ncbi:MAG: RNA polymerase subunit sigma-70 [Gemmatimonadetes bacterium]|nr:RNA polymerase subunit sigma-70 [Gemmatimonadota bacterium]